MNYQCKRTETKNLLSIVKLQGRIVSTLMVGTTKLFYNGEGDISDFIFCFFAIRGHILWFIYAVIHDQNPSASGHQCDSQEIHYYLFK